MKKCVIFKTYLTVCNPGPCEILGIIALRNKKMLLSRLTDITSRNLKEANDLFNENKDIFEYIPPKAGMVTAVKVKGWLAELGCGGARGFSDMLREQQKLMIVPGEYFDLGKDFFRLGIGLESFIENFKKLKQFIKDNRPSN